MIKLTTCNAGATVSSVYRKSVVGKLLEKWTVFKCHLKTCNDGDDVTCAGSPLQTAESCTGWPKKSKPLPNYQKIVLKIANEIRFLRKVKV